MSCRSCKDFRIANAWYRPGAWIDKSKTKAGYEIPFTRTFYEYEELEPAADIAKRIAAREKVLMEKLQALFGNSGEQNEWNYYLWKNKRYGEFTDADRVMVDTLYQKMRKDSKAKKAAKTEDRQVYERSLFPGIFDTTAQEAYMENTAAYEQLFLDADKYQAVMRALADRLYKELHDDK